MKKRQVLQIGVKRMIFWAQFLNMVKCHPGLSQISNMVFLSKVMQLKVLLLLSLYNKIK